jgi:tRNA A-37 threonylcarbamoyl transferase component Bud32
MRFDVTSDRRRDNPECEDLVPDGPVLRRINSLFFRSRDARTGRCYAVKICVDDRTGVPAPESAESEFDALVRVANAMGSGRFGVPVAVALHRTDAKIVTQWIDGKTMTQLVLMRPFSRSNLLRLCHSAGEWLAAFHRSRTLPDGALDLDDKWPQVQELLRSRPVRDEVFLATAAFLSEAAPYVARPILARSWLHGDFKLDNVMVSPDRIVGIDVDASFENVVFYDVASFLNHLSLVLQKPSLALLRRSKTDCYAAFLAGYACAGGHADRLVLQWIMLFQVLDLWKALEQQCPGLSFKRRVQRVHLRGLCRSSLRDAQQLFRGIRAQDA